MKNISFIIKKAIALISDTHFGAYHALFPPEFFTKDGLKIKANKGQKEIYKHWKFFLEKCDEFNVDTVIHLGDIIHGINAKNKTTMFHKLDDQITLAVEMLKEIKKDRSFLLIAGSQFHESIELEIGSVVAERLGGKFLGFVADIEIGFCNKILNIAHSPGNPLIYQATTLDREILFYKLAESKNMVSKADWIIRGHLHTYSHQDNSKIHAMLVPCWCGYEVIRDTKLYGKRQPDIGGIILLIDQYGRIIPMHFLMNKNPMFYTKKELI